LSAGLVFAGAEVGQAGGGVVGAADEAFLGFGPGRPGGAAGIVVRVVVPVGDGQAGGVDRDRADVLLVSGQVSQGGGAGPGRDGGPAEAV
jgi:hypothetical protein